MAISVLGGITPDNWQLISSVTPTNGSAAVNFTGLSTYKKFMLTVNGVALASVDEISLRINNDTASSYFNGYWSSSEQVTVSSWTTRVDFTPASGLSMNGFIVIENCDNSGVKFVSGMGGNGTTSIFVERGIYLASAVVTEINLITDASFNGTGTAALYGAR